MAPTSQPTHADPLFADPDGVHAAAIAALPPFTDAERLALAAVAKTAHRRSAA